MGPLVGRGNGMGQMGQRPKWLRAIMSRLFVPNEVKK